MSENVVAVGLLRADDGTARFEGNVHPFVEIQRNGIGSLDPGELRLDIFCQHRYRTDRAIHMEP